MDAEDLSKAALTAIDEWLDEEIVCFEPEEGLATIRYWYSAEPL
jgi:hypothetical protein